MRTVLLCACFFAAGLDFGPDPTDRAELVPSGIENRGMTCVALAVYAEARSESWFGQALVAQVIVNRQALLPYGADACDVVMAPGQFEGMERWSYPRHPWTDDPVAWAHALDVANAVITGDYAIPSPCTNVTSFKARSEPPAERWGNLVLTCTVEHHDFYSIPLTAADVTAKGRRP